MSTHGNLSDIRHEVMKTRTIVSEVHHDVQEMHHNMLKSQDGVDDPRGPVSLICVLFNYRMNKQLLLLRLKPGQCPLLPIDPASYVYT